MRIAKPQFLHGRWLIILSGLLVLTLIATVALAQRRGGRNSGNQHQKKNAEGLPTFYEVPKDQPDLSGKFIMARVRFDVSMFGNFWSHLGDGGYPWSHDWPGAGRHLNKIISELSKLDINLDVNEPIYGFTDPDLLKYPMAYLCEVGFMNLTDQELQAMREYCLRGGFILVDDFRQPREWYNFESQVKRAFPELPLKKLDISHPVFNCFFSIKTLDVPAPYSNFGAMKPEFWGIEDDKGRLMMVINFNNDVSDYWQWSDDPFAPIEQTNEAYKFGVNYVMYALTH
jgi:Domain of unknown function (DUF4159)